MKILIFLLVVILINNLSIHFTKSASAETTNQPTFTNEEYIEFIQRNGFWAVLEKSNTLVFCFGMDYNDKPACTKVPKKYIVIELPENLQD